MLTYCLFPFNYSSPKHYIPYHPSTQYLLMTRWKYCIRRYSLKHLYSKSRAQKCHFPSFRETFSINRYVIKCRIVRNLFCSYDSLPDYCFMSPIPAKEKLLSMSILMCFCIRRIIEEPKYLMTFLLIWNVQYVGVRWQFIGLQPFSQVPCTT